MVSGGRLDHQECNLEQASCQAEYIGEFLATENFKIFVNPRIGKHFCIMHTSPAICFLHPKIDHNNYKQLGDL